MGKRLRAILGTFVDFDPNQKGDCTCNFLKIRINLDVSTPLRRWIRLDLGDHGVTKLFLEYHDLPFFCLYCGRLNHISPGYPLAKEGVISEPQYGRWRMLSKNDFNIETDGQLSGVSFGLTKKKIPWCVQAP